MKKILLLMLLSFSSLIALCQIDSLHGELAKNPELKSELYFKLVDEYWGKDLDSTLAYLRLAQSSAEMEGNGDVYILSIKDKAVAFQDAGEADSSIYYFNLLEKESANIEVKLNTKAKVYYTLGSHLATKSHYFQSIKYLDTAAYTALQNSDSLLYADILNKKGTANNNMGRETNALELYLEAMDIYKLLGDEDMYGKTINNVAVVFKKSGEYNKALLYYDKAIESSIARGDSIGVAIARVNRGLLKRDLGKYDEAFDDMHYALKQFKNTSFTYGISAAMHNLGEIHLAANNFDSALYFIDKSQEIAISFENNELVANNYQAKAKLYKSAGDFNVSNVFAMRGYNMAGELSQFERLSDLTKIISENYESLGQIEPALKYLKEHYAIEDSIFKQQSVEQLNVLRKEFELEVKDKEIQVLEMEKKSQLKLAKGQRKLNYILGSGVVLFAILIAVLFRLYRKYKTISDRLSQQKELLTEQKEEIETAQSQILTQNENLLKLNKEKDDIMAMVAHDLRSPLNQIRSVLALIQMGQDKASTDQLLTIATQSTEILTKRINRVLDVEAINEGKINLHIDHVDVSEVLKYLRQNTHEPVHKKEMDLEVRVQEGLACAADENYLLQVLENLCSNAIKFSPVRSKIRVKAQAEGDSVLFEVEDQGPGISEKEKNLLFTRYAKLSNKPTGGETSTGLGLAIVKKYVEAMKGEVWCESEINKGSRFFVKIPKHAA
ncbi:tetratricopeptide repeat-containing sensor histidine kinase [Flammeovirgaceae bacterium SG7u.111]|nr:tetratricopeptide repeat-containing sensor histidine kinase [Flammeovirgaceae bacterium SG7u.132]WPO34913.1 tetratricopeptide repeat-containing sensor histidine kinase [Flammeovirgaceae bacterium SG7u.111]